ncbi:MAG: pyridoxine 5'-phosphate synthase [Oligoflexia bacterium]|nr:pyridoxine 5'-phosphate synthase [Oligoflexia bacterium]
MAKKKIRLGVNVDHVATLRQLRKGSVNYPDVLEAVTECLKGGADQITVHLRGDRRHIQESDLRILKKAKVAPINLELAATPTMAEVALKYKPEIVCLVPEKRQELTTEGGLDVVRYKNRVTKFIRRCHQAGIRVSLFIEPSALQVHVSADVGADAVEFHTGQFALARGARKTKELKRLVVAARLAHGLGLKVHAGHGLDYKNVTLIKRIPYLEELNIGHSIVCESVFVGIRNAVKKMKAKL